MHLALSGRLSALRGCPRFAAGVVALYTAATLSAATFVWDGGSATTSNWSDAANWNPNGAPPDNGTADIVMAGTVRITPQVNAADGSWNILSLSFDNTAGSFSIGGTSSLTIGTGGITNNDTSIQAINNNIVLAAAQTWNAASGIIDLFGSISGSFAVTKTGTSTVRLQGTTANTYSGTTTVSTGTLQLNKTASVTALAGDIVIASGATVLSLADHQIGDTSSINVGGFLTFSGVSAETIGSLVMSGGQVSTSSGTLTIGGNVSGGSNGAGDQGTILGNLNLGGATRTFNIAEDAALGVELAISAVISNGAMVKEGGGTLRLSGSNTFAGGITLNAGGLEFFGTSPAGTGTLTLNGGTISGSAATLSNAVTVAADISVAGTGSLTLGGPVTLTGNRTLTVTNTGTTTISGIIGQDVVGRSLTVAGIGTLVLSGVNTFSGGLSVNGAVAFGNNEAAGPGTITLNGGTISASGAARTLSNPVTVNADIGIGGSLALTLNGAVTLTGNRTLTVNNTATNIVAIAQDAVGRTLTKAGSGTLLLSGPNTFSGGLTLTAGTLDLGDDAAAGPGMITLNGGTIRAATAARTLSNAVTLGGDVTIGGSLPLTFNGDVTLAAGDHILTVSNTGTTTIATISQDVAGRALTKAGSGLLVLTGANTFTGGLTVSAGTVAFGNNAAAGPGRLTLAGGTIRADGTARTLLNVLTLGGNITIGGALDLTLTGAATLTGNRTLTVSNTALTTLSGPIGEDAAGRALTKAGAGTLVLSGTNTFSGGLSVAAGELAAGDNAAAGTGTLTFSGGSIRAEAAARTLSNPVLLGANVTVNGSFDLTFTNAIIENAAGRALTKNGSGTLRFTGANSYTGSTTVNDGTLELGNIAGQNSISGPLIIGDGLGTDTVRLAQSNQISDIQPVTLNAGGVLDLATFTAAETVTGLTINGGSAQVGGGSLNAIGSTALVITAGSISGTIGGSFGLQGNLTTNASGTSSVISAPLDLTGATRSFFINDGAALDDLIISSPITNGGLIKLGAGRLKLSGTSSYSGNTTINAGALLVDGSVLNSSTTVNNGGLLGGTGTTSTLTIANGGSLSPGASVGTLTTGNLTLNSSSISLFELASAGAVGGVNDLVIVIGAFTLDGVLAVTELPGFTNGIYRLFNHSGPLTNNGLDLEASFLTAHPGSLIDTTTIGQVNLVVVPEPIAGALLGIAVCALLGLRRRS
jgi:fibronectin-binding autotransporter adhesin